MNSEEAKNNFFILNEKDGTYSAYIRFGGYKDKEDAQFVIDAILVELGMMKPIVPINPTYH